MSEESLKILEFTETECNLTTKYFDKSELDNISLFCYCMLDRLNFSCCGIKHLIAHFIINTKLEYNIGIILRSFTLDYLIMLNVIEKLKNKDSLLIDTENELHIFCTSFLCDSMKITLDNISLLYKSYPNDIKSKMYLNVISNNLDCFDPYKDDGTKPTLKKMYIFKNNEQKPYNMYKKLLEKIKEKFIN